MPCAPRTSRLIEAETSSQLRHWLAIIISRRLIGWLFMASKLAQQCGCSQAEIAQQRLSIDAGLPEPHKRGQCRFVP